MGVCLKSMKIAKNQYCQHKNNRVKQLYINEMFLSCSLPMIKFQFPRKNVQRASETQLVDSLEVVGESVIATKCALHGVIYLWDLTATLAASGKEHTTFTVTPICVLSWSNTDNYFMNMGCHPGDCYSVLVPTDTLRLMKHTNTTVISSLIYSFQWHVQNLMIPCRSQELLPFLSVTYFFLPPFSTNYSSILSHPILPSISWSTSQSCCSQIHI